MTDPYHPPKPLRQPVYMGKLSSRIEHFATWGLFDSVQHGEIERLKTAVDAMNAIEGVTSICFGKELPFPGLTLEHFDYAFVEAFSSMAAVRHYLPHPLHRATIDLSRKITKEGRAIYFQPLASFDVVPVNLAERDCIQVALIYLKNGGNELEIRQLIEAVEALRSIPDLVDISFGPRAPTSWIGPDDSIDCALVISFSSQKSAIVAVSHEAHIQLQKLLQRVSERSTWYSFEVSSKK